MQQFFIPTLTNPKLSKEQMHQVRNVLKMKQGEQIRLVDETGAGCYARFDSQDLESIEILSPIEWFDKRIRIRLVASLIRAERLEWMIQKSCECGIDEIVLYRADRGVVRDFGKREDRKLERFNAIALEASEQAYRRFPAKVLGIIDKKDLETTRSQVNVYGDTSSHPYILDYIEPSIETITVYIGPEGGFSDNERSLFERIGIQAVSFGPYIYRAETAPLAVATLLSTLEMK